MNQYKIEVKEILKKDIIVCAKDEEEALNFIEKACTKSDILTFHDDNVKLEIETKIIQKNGNPVKENGIILDEDEVSYLEGLITEINGLSEEISENIVEIAEIINENKEPI